MRHWLTALICLLLAGGQLSAKSEPFVYADLAAPDKTPHYLVIAPRNAVDPLLPLVRHRAGSGMVVRIAPLESILSADPDRDAPGAIQAFVRRLRDREDGDTLRYLLLVGSGSKKAEGFYLPAWTVDAEYVTTAHPCDEELVGDAPYGMRADETKPTLAIGRFPARSLDDLTVMVRKTLQSENAAPTGRHRRSLEVAAGQGGFGVILDRISEHLFQQIASDQIPDYIDVNLTYANPGSPYCYAPNRLSEYLVERLGDGPGMLVYIGHGQPDSFDSFRWKKKRESILTADDVAKIRIPDARTLLVSIACHTGRFDGSAPSIGEQLMTSPHGPAAFIGSSRISQPYPNALLGESLIKHLMTGPARSLGDAWLTIQNSYEDNSAFRQQISVVAGLVLGLDALGQQRTDQILMYNLLGDPALRTGFVPDGCTVTAPAAGTPGSEITVHCTSPIPTGTARFSISVNRDDLPADVSVVAESDPDWEQKMIETHRRANDKVIVVETVDLADGKASWTLTVPEDCPQGKLHVNVYTASDTADAAGSTTITVLR
jgi:hypothetical protein